jgi:hypothetical protein
MAHFLKWKIKEFFVIQYPSGRWGYVGRVPIELAYVDGTTQEEIEQGKLFGERFGPKIRIFDTENEAIIFAKNLGYVPGKVVKK